MKCDFCAELRSSEETLFRATYKGLLETRIVLRNDRFAVLPTIGQLFEGSYLVIPTGHVERYAELSVSLRREALDLISRVEARLHHYGLPIIYEHGASCAEGTGCGVYHAHVHVVPLPRAASCEELLVQPGTPVETLHDAWEVAATASEYLAVRDTSGKTVLLTRDTPGLRLGSQFMRRRLAEAFGIQQPWDWREYSRPEPRLLRSVAALR
jgi:diadenosine tetraphosphate (Ap4A) HIT family hydrolase